MQLSFILHIICSCFCLPSKLTLYIKLNPANERAFVPALNVTATTLDAESRGCGTVPLLPHCRASTSPGADSRECW